MIDPVTTLTRRRLLEFGTSGLTLGGLWRAQALPQPAPSRRTSIKACILVFYYGGPSHIDTYDLKPQAPAEVRGSFRPIQTSATGVHVCEHLPQMARVMHKVALVRSVTHAATLHDSASIHALTGRRLDGPDRELFAPLPQVHPSYGSAVSALRPGPRPEVPFAALPFPFRNVHEVPCQGAGFLGSAHEPLWVEGDPANRRYRADVLHHADGVSGARLDGRRSLLAALEHTSASDPLRAQREKAYQLLDSVAVRRALEIEREPLRVRDGTGSGPKRPRSGKAAGAGTAPRWGTRGTCAGRTCCSPGAWWKPGCRS